MKKYKLICSVCGAEMEDKYPYLCPKCQGPAQPVMDIIDKDPDKAREVIKGGCVTGIWDYKDLLPAEDIEKPVTMGEGNTPLVYADNLSEKYGFNVYLKNEGLNPSSTYKDRFASLAMSHEKVKGAKAVALGSAGNAAAACSAYAAKAGIPCFVFLPPDAAGERAKQVKSYGVNLIRMEHTIDDCIRMADRGVGEFGWSTLSTCMSANPVYSEGYKTIGYEIGKQLKFKAPDWIITPIGGGAVMSKTYRAFEDMLKLGLIDKMPKFAGDQALACSPLVEAWEKGYAVPKKWDKEPNTIAFAIADVVTFDGVKVLDILKKTGGQPVALTEDELLTATLEIAANEGIMAEPASAGAFGAAKKLKQQGIIKDGETVVCVLTGSALRDLNLLSENQPKAEVPVAAPDLELVKPAVAKFMDVNK